MRSVKTLPSKSNLSNLTSTKTPPPIANIPVRWSDVVAGRKSTHPDAAPIKPILDTTELCENVLQYLSLKELIRVQLVCRAIRSTVKTSPKLQTMLFAKPAVSSNSNIWLLDYNHNLLVGSKASQYLDNLTAKALVPQSMKACVYNPLLLSKSRQEDGLPLAFRFRQSFDYPNNSNEDFCLSIGDKVWSLSNTASCRSMFLSQPPVTKVVVEVDGRCDYPPWEDRRGLPKWFWGCVSRRTIENASGLTFGQLVDDVRSAIRYCDGRSVGDIHFPNAFLVSQEQKDSIELENK